MGSLNMSPSDCLRDLHPSVNPSVDAGKFAIHYDARDSKKQLISLSPQYKGQPSLNSYLGSTVAKSHIHLEPHTTGH